MEPNAASFVVISIGLWSKVSTQNEIVTSLRVSIAVLFERSIGGKKSVVLQCFSVIFICF